MSSLDGKADEDKADDDKADRMTGRARALQLPNAGMGLTIFIPEFVRCTIVAT
jgi:hypothetical protein